ncbi:hypothetical protein SteCoe_20551 [Stentor coeruleus]|uniref:Uncharacterized protein n=1 Tax=Stentor coeruleus TaxID=5963 RepID=A0A1R2BRJ8_9CILI|nr:hypothetical protein SteCoe_20551 [Stentor coeruleus]
MEEFGSISRRSRMNNEENLSAYTRFEDSLKIPMRPIIEAHNELQNTYNNLDELIDEVVSQNEWLLNSRYLARLKQEEEKLQHLKDQLQKDYYEIENNPEVFNLDREMKSYTAQTEALSRFSYQLKTQTDLYHNRYNEEKDYVQDLKDKLKEITKENLKISYSIEEFKAKPLESVMSRSKLPSLNSKYSMSQLSLQTPLKLDHLNEIQKTECILVLDEVHKIKKEIKETKEVSQHLSTLQGAFLTEQKKLEEFFQDCFIVAKQKLIQNQQMPQLNKKGLAGSLFFDLIQNEKINQIAEALQDKTYRSSLQDRDSKNILYYTVQRMIKTARNDQRKEQISKIQLSRDDFNTFTSLQILGLLCLRNDIQVELHLSIFPANLLHIQYINIPDLKKSKNRQISKPKKKKRDN